MPFQTNKPGIIAPGTAINFVNTGNIVLSVTGTSFAAPLVTGVIAHLHEAKNNLKFDFVTTKAILLAGADRTVISNVSNPEAFSGNDLIREKSGLGMLNARNTLQIAEANNYCSFSSALGNLSDGLTQSMTSLILSNNSKIRLVLTFDKPELSAILQTGYTNNIDLSLSVVGSTYASSNLQYSNVEVLEYTIMTFDIYDIYAVFTEINEDLSTYSMTVSVAWYVSSVSS